MDSESTLYAAWLELYAEHAQELPVEHFTAVIGSATHFDPVAHLQTLIGSEPALDVEATHLRIRTRYAELVDASPVLPGVVDRIAEADRLGWPRGVASSSRRPWVVGHLSRLGLGDGWAGIRCRDEAPRAKPHPDLYQAVVADMGVEPAEAVALEDSPNGLTAARAAGLWAVAVPGPLTRGLDLSMAHLRLESLASATLQEICARLVGRAG